jgi:hypothetical protein
VSFVEQDGQDLQNITQKTKDRTTRTPLKQEVNSGVPEEKAGPAPQMTPVMILLS